MTPQQSQSPYRSKHCRN